MKDHGAFTYVREMAPIGEMQGCVQVTVSPRHCERSEAIHVSARGDMDCFVASLLAMTARISHPSLNPYSGTLPLAP